MTAPALVQKLCIYCNLLRDDGLSYGDCVEQREFAFGDDTVERRLSVIDELEIVVTTNLARATRLRQSVLQSAFSLNP